MDESQTQGLEIDTELTHCLHVQPGECVAVG